MCYPNEQHMYFDNQKTAKADEYRQPSLFL